jgi:TonB family protein
MAASAALSFGRAAAAPLPSDKQPEPAVMGGPADVEYLRKVHAHVHKRWADNFLALIGQNLALSNPLNDGTRVAEADIVIGPDGKLVSATVTKSSGFAGFDDAVPEVLRDSAPFPAPPQSARSDDDNLHLHWTFARDQRRCSGVAVLHVDDPLEIAIPKLMHKGRRDEMVARLQSARTLGTHAEPSVTTLANEWLHQAAREPWMTVRIAGALAARGDTDAVAWLKGALKRPELARAAGPILSTNKIPVCPLVKAALEGSGAGANAAERLSAAQALATSGEAACAPGLIKLLQDPKAKSDVRSAAATALGPIEDEEATKTLAAAAKDEPNMTVRAAATLAQIRPNAGRAKMMTMVRFLKDPSVEMRAAASAGLVRAGGDSDLNDLYLLFKDTDPRPAEATIRELERVPTEEATKMIAKLLRRPLVPVQKAAAHALVTRRAKSAFPALKPMLEGQTDPEMHGLALVAADDAMLVKLTEDPKMGIWVYRALLARGERDRAADWLLAHLSVLLPQNQADALVDWLSTADAPTASASKVKH